MHCIRTLNCLKDIVNISRGIQLGTKSCHVHEGRSQKFVRQLSGLSKNITVTPAKPKYSFGLCGCGRIAGVHLKNILSHRRIDLKWIVEDSEDRINDVRCEFLLDDSVPFYSSRDVTRLLQDRSLDAIVVNSPTNTHTDYICRGLQNGKAVFCEKPAGESVGDIRTCYETAEKHGRPLLTGYNRRFDPTFRRMYETVTSGLVGQVQLIRTTSRDSPKPSYEFLKTADSTGCNILSDMGVHDIDLIVWVTGAARPESIYVTCHSNDPELRGCGQPDAMAAIIKYDHGILATMDVFRESCYGYDIRMEVFGSGGMTMADNPRESSAVSEGLHGGKRERLTYSFPQRFETAFAMELDHFLDCLDGTALPLITKDESVCVAEIIEKGVQSYNENRLITFS